MPRFSHKLFTTLLVSMYNFVEYALCVVIIDIHGLQDKIKQLNIMKAVFIFCHDFLMDLPLHCFRWLSSAVKCWSTLKARKLSETVSGTIWNLWTGMMLAYSKFYMSVYLVSLHFVCIGKFYQMSDSSLYIKNILNAFLCLLWILHTLHDLLSYACRISVWSITSWTAEIVLPCFWKNIKP